MAEYVRHATGVEDFFGEVNSQVLSLLSENHHPALETAVMNADGSLTTARGVTINEGDYIVRKYLRPYNTLDGLVGVHDDVDGNLLQHNHPVPGLNVGDTVLLAWADLDAQGHGTPWVVAVR